MRWGILFPFFVSRVFIVFLFQSQNKWTWVDFKLAARHVLKLVQANPDGVLFRRVHVCVIFTRSVHKLVNWPPLFYFILPTFKLINYLIHDKLTCINAILACVSFWANFSVNLKPACHGDFFPLLQTWIKLKIFQRMSVQMNVVSFPAFSGRSVQVMLTARVIRWIAALASTLYQWHNSKDVLLL